MPKRRKHTTLTRRDIKNIQNMSPAGIMIFAGIAAGIIVFVLGVILVIVFASLLHSVFGFSNEFTFLMSAFAILALIALAVAIIIGMSVFLIRKYRNTIEKKYRGMKIANIDAMSGIEFEHYLKRVLTHKGFNVSTTRASGDLGVDLVALGNSNKFAIQVKRYNGKVSRNAVSDAVAGMHHYRCNKAMVITNNYFSPGAIELAKSTGCILIDRDMLATWINEYQSVNIHSLSDSTNRQTSVS
jgi:restriction system protein